MSRRFWVLVCVTAGAILGIARGSASGPRLDPPAQAVAGPAAVVPLVAGPIDDPFPIQRVRATEAQLNEILEPLHVGPLVRLSRSDFEDRVHRAARTAAASRSVPRLTDVRFKAALTRGDLAGTAELDIVNPAGTPRFLPLDPLRLALGSATWADGREAVIGVPVGGTGAAVWVDRPGQQTLHFKWSMAGASELGERRFELRVPAAPTAELVLELPTDQAPTASATEVLLTGPFPLKGDPPRADWRFRFGGRPRLDFAVRPVGTPAVPASAALVARYDLSPGQLIGTFEYDLRPAKGTVGEWAFTIDSGLRVTDVVVNNRAGWTIDQPATPGGPRRLRVALNQPGAGGKVLVSVMGPFPDPGRPAAAPLPVVRPENADLDDEAIDIRLDSSLKPENWNSGDYRLTDAQVLPDQSRWLKLVGTLLPPGAARAFRRPPTLRTAPAEVEFTTREQVEWHFGSNRATATVRMALKVRRGLLFDFALRFPQGYSLKSASSSPEDSIAYSGSTGGVATTEFLRPLATGQSAELTFEFAGPRLGAGATSLPFPEFFPLGATERVGVLALCPGPLWAIDPVPGPGVRPAAWFDPGQPLVTPDATVAYQYRGTGPSGSVKVVPMRGVFSVDTTTQTAAVPGALLATTTFAIQMQSGAISDLVIAGTWCQAADRRWRVQSGGNAVAAAVFTPVLGGLWTIRFARPVSGDLTLVTTSTEPLASGLTAEARGELETRCGQWTVLGAGALAKPQAIDPAPVRPPAWSFSGLYLVTAVRSPGDSVAVFGGVIDSSATLTLPIQLPPGAELRAASIGGRWVEPGACRLTAGGVLNLPAPSQGAVRFEVRYRPAVDTRGPIGLVTSGMPTLPTRAEIGRWWVFSPEVLPGWPVRAWDRGDISELPPMLGELPIPRGEGAVVSRSPVERVRVGTVRAAGALGIGLAAALVALAWAGGRRRHVFCALLLVGAIGGTGCASLLGPPWWQRAAAVPLALGLVAAAVMAIARAKENRPAVLAPAAAAILFGLFQLDSMAQPPLPSTVVILPADAKGREMIVAPKLLLDRLDAGPPKPGVVLSAADYAVTADDAGARVRARFVVHALGEGEALVTLPLADARLERLTVNGAAAFPAAPRPGVYTVALPGKGRYEIEAAFGVPLAGTAPEREVRFGVPECPVAHLNADLPALAQQVQAVGRIGQQSTAGGARVRLVADLGAVKAVHLRWREGTAGTAAIKIREGCVWDLSESGAELTACYSVRVEQGAISTLSFELPAELDPLGVSVRSLEIGGVATLRDWSLGAEKGGFRPLRVDLQAPTAGRLLVVLTCAPRNAVTRQPVLRFPRPMAAKPGERDAAFLLRFKGVAIEEFGRSGVIDFAPDALARDRDFGGVTELRLDPNAPGRAFRLSPGGNPELKPTLHAVAEQPHATLETRWHLSPQRAVASGTIRWSGKDATALVEFVLPGAKLLEARGADVASWSQSGARVQVWLRKPLADGELEWEGAVDAPASPFEAVTPRLSRMHLNSSTVRIMPAEGFALAVERDRGWEPGGTSDGAAIDRTTTNPAAPVVRVHPTPAPRSERAAQPEGVRPAPAARPPRKPPAPTVPAPTPSIATTPPDAPRWVRPVSTALGWAGAITVLIVLLVRFPTSTWPEQLGILAGLLGLALFENAWLGVSVWVLIRIGHLVMKSSSTRPELMSPQ